MTFKERFCAYFRCPEEQFESAALWELLPKRSRLIARLIFLLKRSFFDFDLRLIRQIGFIASRTNLRAEAHELRNDYLRHGDFRLFRRILKLRISGEQLLSVAAQIWQE